MAFIPAPQVAEFVMRYQSVSGAQMVNVFNILHTNVTWSPEELEDMATILHDWEQNTARLYRCSGVSLIRISARDISQQFGAILEQDVSPAIVGSVSTPPLPGNVTFCISYRTGLAGRSNRGRHYWIGLGEAHVDGDVVTQTTADNIQGALTLLNDVTLANAGAIMVVVSRQVNKAPRVTAFTPGINAIFYVDRFVDTQRRRLFSS